MTHRTQRVVGLIDMDCFYVQVEQRDRPELWGKPVVVVQYNQFRKGGIIAVGYEARAFGIKRGGMRGADAEQLCPDVTLVSIPVQRGKANLTKYRDASAEVFRVLSSFTPSIVVERASIDEAYLDLTAYVDHVVETEENLDTHSDIELMPDTHVFLKNGKDRENSLREWMSTATPSEVRLAIGAELVERIRKAVKEKTQFHCSAGIAANKMLAKLACGLHKPRQQTILPDSSLRLLWEETKISKVRNLGGKLGAEVCERFGVLMMAELMKIPEHQLIAAFGDKTGKWLYAIAQGVDSEPVKEKDLLRSIGCGKNFMGKEALDTVEKIRFWITSLTEELVERLICDKTMNHRVACSLSVGIRNKLEDGETAASTRAVRIREYSVAHISELAFGALKEFNVSKDTLLWHPQAINLGLYATRFEDSSFMDGVQPITQFFMPSAVEPDSEPKSSLQDDSCALAPPNPLTHKQSNDDHDLNQETVSGVSDEVHSADVDEHELSVTQEFHAEIQNMESDTEVANAIGRKTGSLFVKKLAHKLENNPLSSIRRKVCATESLLMQRSRTYSAVKARKPVTQSAVKITTKNKKSSNVKKVQKLSRRSEKKLPADSITLGLNGFLKSTTSSGSSKKDQNLPSIRSESDMPCCSKSLPNASNENPCSSSSLLGTSVESSAEPDNDLSNVSTHNQSTAAGENGSVLSHPCHEGISDATIVDVADEDITMSDLCPDSLDSIDKDVFAALPEFVKLELFGHFRPKKNTGSAAIKEKSVRTATVSKNVSGCLDAFVTKC